MKTFDTVAKLKLAKLKEGQFVETGGYYAKGDAGAARYLIVTPQSFDGYGDHELANGNIAVLQVNGVVFVKQFGAKGDNVADDTLPIQSAFNYSEYIKVVISEGIYRTSGILYPKEGCIVEFFGSIKFLDGLSPPPTSVLRLREPSITLVEPKLDGNTAGITNPGGNGQYTVLAAYPQTKEPTDCKIIGGTISNGWHNVIQGGGKNLLVSGTRIENAGEHLIYISESDGAGGTTGTRITFENLTLVSPALDTAQDEGHYFQIRNSGDTLISNCHCYGAGSADINEPTFGILFQNSEDLVVVNSIFSDVTNKFLWIDQGTALISNTEVSTKAGVSEKALAYAETGTRLTFSNVQSLGYRVNTELDSDHLRVIGCRFVQGSRWEVECKASIDNCYFDMQASNYNMLVKTGGDVNINNSTFETQSGWGISAEAGTKLTLSDCRIEGAGTISVGGVGSEALITGNRFPDATSTSTIRILSSQDTSAIIANNYLPLGDINDSAVGTVISANVTV